MAWRRVNHPSEVLAIGETVKVQIIRINPETQRISLGMKQLEADPWEGVDAKYPVGAKFTRPRHQHHRLRRLRGAGAGRRGPGPRLRNVLDQEERPPRQDRLDLAGSRRDGAGRRRRQAPHLARPQAGACATRGKSSPRRTRSARPSKAKSRTSPSSACSSASTATSTAWSTCPTSTGTGRAKRRIAEVPQGRDGQGQGARRRRREGAHLARHQAARRAIRSPRRSSGVQGGEIVTVDGHRDRGRRHRGEVDETALTGFIRRSDLSRDRHEQRPERFAVGEKVDAKVTDVDPKTPQARPLDQGAGDRRREGGGRAVRLVRLGRLAGRHPGRGAEGREQVRVFTDPHGRPRLRRGLFVFRPG